MPTNRAAYTGLQEPPRAVSITLSKRFSVTARIGSPEDSATQTQDQAQRESDAFAEECDCRQDAIHPMTHHRACQLLGVTSTSTQRQIKAAYRRKVSQWHPDRLESRTKEVRLLATEQMAAINEAYRLLRGGLI